MRKIFIILLFALASCNAERKLNKAIKVFNDNEMLSSQYCADKYPVIDTLIKGDTIYIKETFIDNISDTIVLNDTIRIETTKTNTIRETKLVVDTIVKENTARVNELNLRLTNCRVDSAVLSKQIVSLKDELKQSKKETDKWKIRFFLLLIIAGASHLIRSKFF